MGRLGKLGLAAALTLAAAWAAVTVRAGSSDRPAEAGASRAETSPRIRPWDRLLPASRRFTPALGGAAILDRETGLVWDKAPDTAPVAWVDAPFTCFNRSVGGRRGWRLPTVEEILSLVDPSASSPALPAGHPFVGIQPDLYWTATSIAGFGGEAYGVSMADGSLSDQSKAVLSRYWCVRGGFGYDGM
jgi:hypothetical protein